MIALLLSAAAAAAPIAFVGATVHPVARPAFDDGVVVVEDGRILAVGPRGEVVVPADAVVRDVSGQHLIPGLVDSHSHIGGGRLHESIGPVQPGISAIDAIDPTHVSLERARAGGITTANVMPGSGKLMGGQTAYLKLRDSAVVDDLLLCLPGGDPAADADDPASEAALTRRSLVCGGMKMANGTNPQGDGGDPKSRMGAAFLQREAFLEGQERREAVRKKAKAKAKKRKRGPEPEPFQPDLDADALVQVLDGTRRVHFHTHRADDIVTALRLQEEFGFTVVLHHVSEAWKVADLLGEREAMLSLIVVDSPGGKEEALEITAANAPLLAQKGALVALHTDDPITDSRLFLRMAAQTVRAGLPPDAALAALTLNPARMMALDDRVGSLEAGKDADLVLLSGPPLSTWTHVLETWVEGQRVFDRSDPTDRAHAVGGDGPPQRTDFDPWSDAMMAPLTAVLLTLVAPSGAETLLFQADRVVTAAGPDLLPGAVLVEDGRIVAVGPLESLDVPDGTRAFKGAVLTPGLIDAWTTAGLTGPLNHQPDQDHAERDDPVRPELRALDAYHPHDPLVGWLRGFGVTTLHAGPSPGQPVGGRTLITRTTPGPVDAIARIPDAFVVLSLGDVPKSRFSAQGAASRMGGAAAIRQALTEAQEYKVRRALRGADRAPVDLGLEALVSLLDGDRKAMVYAHRSDDLLTALRIGEEFGLELVLAGAAEGWLVADALAAAEVPVVVGPVMARSWRPGEQRNANFENAAILADAGVQVAFLSGYEGYVPKVRVVLWEAAVAAANGLGPDRALRALTLDAAQLLGIDDRTGSLEPGKDADLVLFDGDPLEVTSHACVVAIGGAIVSEECR